MSHSSDWSSGDRSRRSERMVAVWSLIWALAFLGADVAIERGWVEGAVPVGVAVAVVGLLGVGWVRSYARFLRAADELMRKIQLDAMAMAVGAGFVVGFALILLESAAVLEARPDHVLLAMVGAYVAAVVLGMSRFGGDER